MIADKKRKILADTLCENSLLIMVGKSEILRNGDVTYPFRQDSDFLLLTGADVPDLRLIGKKGHSEMEWILYSDEITPLEKVWGTSRLSHSELRVLTGIDDIREMKHWKRDITIFSGSVESIAIRAEDEKRVFPGFSKYRTKYTPLDLRELRLIKLPEEIEKIRKAISITHEAYRDIRECIRPGMYEYEIEAEIARVYRAHHTTEAYPSIVASGANVCTLHYTKHSKKLEAGELLLVDFGAEYEGYASDITRVFAVPDSPLIKGARGIFDAISGFSPRQKEVYDSVLAVKAYAELQIRPGVLKSDYEKCVRARMDAELIRLGLISLPLAKGGRGDLVPEVLSRKYYPHSTSHFLGLDVHDVGSREEVFRPGMVITCEPGIYIPEEGIGIRLEDDILITDDGCENLSREIPLGFEYYSK